ncbi:MAG: acylphosphatase [Gammaproteobacteria bacterium]|nr:acylphosphatase [Gammaproteobacteria bacterium]
MVKKIISFFRAILAAGLHVANLFFWGTILTLFSFLRFLIPWSPWRHFLYRVMNHIPEYWIDFYQTIIKLTTPVHWEIDDISELNPKGWYLLLPNHQSWLDILVLGITFNRKIPLLKFFIKKQLRWIPFVGSCSHALDFPFMERYSKTYLKKHPEKKGKDSETTRKACEKFKTIPTSIINFCEGTRFTPAKQKHQSSPFQHLLKPKAGGIAFVLSTMGEYLHQLLDVTIIYPQGNPSAWQFLCGQLDHIIVKVRLLPITPELMGNYEGDTKFRQVFQKWLNELWYEKDELITYILASAYQCRHYFISGRVQGVWYRAHAKKKARKLHLTGWVRNLPDGRVEAVACGKETSLTEFETWLYQGPEKACVEDVSIELIKPHIFKRFSVR